MILKYVNEMIYSFFMWLYKSAETLALICIVIAFIAMVAVIVEAVLKSRKS